MITPSANRLENGHPINRLMLLKSQSMWGKWTKNMMFHTYGSEQFYITLNKENLSCSFRDMWRPCHHSWPVTCNMQGTIHVSYSRFVIVELGVSQSVMAFEVMSHEWWYHHLQPLTRISWHRRSKITSIDSWLLSHNSRVADPELWARQSWLGK